MAKFLGMENASKPQDFLTMLDKLQKDCGVDNLKMSDYGISEDELPKMAENAKDCMGFLFNFDRVDLTIEDCVQIYKNSYK